MESPEVKLISFNYQESDRLIVQGNRVNYYEKRGYYKKKGGNGTYIMVQPSKAEVTAMVDGTQITQSVKELIRDYYGISRVNNHRLRKFFDDCNSGIIKLKYDGSRIYF